MSDDWIACRATFLVERLAAGDVGPHDLLDALERRIGAIDSSVNALPTLCFERARAHADRLLRLPPERRGRLAGLPVPIKDLSEVAGVRTTFGSPIFANHVPAVSDVMVERLEAEGGIVYAKSNTPEFGAGANTFNPVFGATRNPHDLSKSAAGSSGGAAAALASGMAFVAQGSDVGGSLRNPASFCGIVGLRPTPGRVARSPPGILDDTLGVLGPMARNVEDVALLLDAMAGEDARDPLSKPRPQTSFLEAARSGWRPARVAWSADLGVGPVDPEIAAITQRAAQRFGDLGAIVKEAHPDLSQTGSVFHVLRAKRYGARAELLRRHRELLKPEVIWNIEAGLSLTIDQVLRAEAERAAMARRARGFFERFDLLVCPATILPPFPVEERWPKSCAGHVFDNYVEWLNIAAAITLIASPALSLPCGFTATGLPVGLQIVAPPNGEGRLLAAAKALEEVLDLNTTRPITPRAEAATAMA